MWSSGATLLALLLVFVLTVGSQYQLKSDAVDWTMRTSGGQTMSSASDSWCRSAHKTLRVTPAMAARHVQTGLAALSVAKVSRANDESGDFLFDRRAFLSQSWGRLIRWSSSNSYGCSGRGQKR
jgi:hypothetical protein